MIKAPHSINGKVVGAWYELDDGRKLYLAHVTPRHLIRDKMAWGLYESGLDFARVKGCTAAGVVLRKGGKLFKYLSPIDDFFDLDKAFKVYSKLGHQRALPTQMFAIHPGVCLETISKFSTILK